jgi:hypothetical protein
MTYIFELTVQDNLWKETIVCITLFSVFILSVILISKRFEVQNNWTRMRCRPEVMQYAWLYGKDKTSNMEYCLENAGKQFKGQDIVAATTKFIIDENIKTNADLNAKIAITDATLKTFTNTNAIINSNKIIESIKEGIRKTIAALQIQNNLNNGIYKTTSATRTLNTALAKITPPSS